MTQKKYDKLDLQNAYERGFDDLYEKCRNNHGWPQEYNNTWEHMEAGFEAMLRERERDALKADLNDLLADFPNAYGHRLLRILDKMSDGEMILDWDQTAKLLDMSTEGLREAVEDEVLTPQSSDHLFRVKDVLAYLERDTEDDG